MKIKYRNKAIEKLCTNIKEAKKKLNVQDGEGLLKTIGFIESANSLEDIRQYKRYNLHKLRGNLDGSYAIDIRGRSSPYRLLIKPLNLDGSTYDNFDLIRDSKEIEVIKVEEVSKHYEK